MTARFRERGFLAKARQRVRHAPPGALSLRVEDTTAFYYEATTTHTVNATLASHKVVAMNKKRQYK